MKVDDLTKGVQRLYFWLTVGAFAMAAALVTALYSLSIPNASLVCYGFILLSIWQTMPALRHQVIYILADYPQNRVGYSIVFNTVTLVFIYISIVSAAATFWLFPHPMMHKIMALFFYVVGSGFALWGLFHGGLLLQGAPPEEYINYYQQSEMRKQQLEERLAKLDETADKVTGAISDYLDGAREQNEFKVYLPFSSILSRCAYILLWLSIPAWLFIAIPLRSYSWLQLPPFFIVAGLATILLGGIWIVSFFRSTSYRYKISERGISRHGWLAERALVWENIAFLYLNEQMLTLRAIHGTSLHMRLEDLESPSAFWQKLQHFLPLEFFFISEEGWSSLQKLLKEDYEYFSECYYHTFFAAKKSEKSGKRKKKKKGGKNRG